MQLHREQGRIEAAGGTLVLVGNGSVAHARHFAEKFVPGVLVTTDPGLRSYSRLRLRRGVLRTLTPAGLRETVAAARRGQTQSAVQGDAWQQGGFFVFDAAGRMIHRQISENPSDRPDLDGILAALRSISAAA